MFNGGAIPYPGTHPQAILNYLEGGERLAKPKNLACCSSMYMDLHVEGVIFGGGGGGGGGEWEGGRGRGEGKGGEGGGEKW